MRTDDEHRAERWAAAIREWERMYGQLRAGELVTVMTGTGWTARVLQPSWIHPLTGEELAIVEQVSGNMVPMALERPAPLPHRGGAAVVDGC